jgi:uncharacterized SAM-binding protein YcdF (DUF218 family)
MELWAKIAGLLLSPPALLLGTALLGYLLVLKWRWLGHTLVGLSLVALYFLSLPPAGRQLLLPLESQYPPLRWETLTDTPTAADAIVVLGAGRYADAKEYGGADTVNPPALERLRYAANLQAKLDLPILVSGGSVYGEARPEAALMREVLEKDFRAKVRWVEDRSQTTLENARLSKLVLQQDNIKRVYLVTHAWHMPRAVWSFTDAGLQVIAAPMGFTTLNQAEHGAFAYLPSAHGLRLTGLAFHERLGLKWYHWKHTSPAVIEAATPAKK